MSPVDFKKWPCRPVEFKGQRPYFNMELLLFFSHEVHTLFTNYILGCSVVQELSKSKGILENIL